MSTVIKSVIAGSTYGAFLLLFLYTLLNQILARSSELPKPLIPSRSIRSSPFNRWPLCSLASIFLYFSQGMPTFWTLTFHQILAGGPPKTALHPREVPIPPAIFILTSPSLSTIRLLEMKSL